MVAALVGLALGNGCALAVDAGSLARPDARAPDGDDAALACRETLPGEYAYAFDRGLLGAPIVDPGIRLVPPRRLVVNGLTGGPACELDLPSCGTPGVITVGDVAAVLADPDVERALATPRAAFGATIGGSGYVLAHDGAEILIGGRCNGLAGCREPPPGIQRLYDTMRALRRQAAAARECAADAQAADAADDG